MRDWATTEKVPAFRPAPRSLRSRASHSRTRSRGHHILRPLSSDPAARPGRAGPRQRGPLASPRTRRVGRVREGQGTSGVPVATPCDAAGDRPWSPLTRDGQAGAAWEARLAALATGRAIGGGFTKTAEPATRPVHRDAGPPASPPGEKGRLGGPAAARGVVPRPRCRRPVPNLGCRVVTARPRKLRGKSRRDMRGDDRSAANSGNPAGVRRSTLPRGRPFVTSSRSRTRMHRDGGRPGRVRVRRGVGRRCGLPCPCPHRRVRRCLQLQAPAAPAPPRRYQRRGGGTCRGTCNSDRAGRVRLAGGDGRRFTGNAGPRGTESSCLTVLGSAPLFGARGPLPSNGVAQIRGGRPCVGGCVVYPCAALAAAARLSRICLALAAMSGPRRRRLALYSRHSSRRHSSKWLLLPTSVTSRPRLSRS